MLAAASDARAQCPTVDNVAWGQRAVVRFFLEANLSDEQKRQIRVAVGEWNRANAINNSRVRFEEDTTGGNFVFRFTNGTLAAGTPAFAQKQFSPDGTVVSATLTYDPNATFIGTNTLIANPNAPGYSTFIVKLTLHEMGHTMGLDHPAVPNGNPCEQPDGASVMNYICNVNDSSNNMPTQVTTCDQNAINSMARFPFPGPATNPIDDPQFFVAQHYRDFFGREADAPGLAFWTNQITQCGTDAGCIDGQRTNTSGSFFLSIEFQETGYLVYRFFESSFNRRPTFAEFLPDLLRVDRNVIVGQGDWQAQLEANKTAYANEFVQRPAFVAQYPTTLTPAEYVDRLNANTDFSLSQAERDALVNGLSAGTETRATVLRKVAEDRDYQNREFRPAFVHMQYLGYLRRDPDEAGFNFWLNKLNEFNGDYHAAQMVRSFIVSGEYRARFGTP
ncbi:MAG TPA: DUF4214 domain-containing protein [Pyrinomonadaceae bacterium]|nr:DUF4214 domain-containing protein [Pyrinomonadaceae bacterium]